MNKPCEHCDKADYKKYGSDYFKCEKPCERAKMCKRNDEKFFKMLRGGGVDVLSSIGNGYAGKMC